MVPASIEVRGPLAGYGVIGLLAPVADWGLNVESAVHFIADVTVTLALGNVGHDYLG